MKSEENSSDQTEKAPFISLIITTYDNPKALRMVLQALTEQTAQDFEIVIADDGSDAETLDTIKTFQPKFMRPLKHAWHPHDGFRAAKIRNRAVLLAEGDYLVFLDGDCVPRPHFFEKHRKFAEKGWFVAGNRIFLSSALTQNLFDNEYSLQQISFIKWVSLRLQKWCNRIFPLLDLPLGRLRKITLRRWRGVRMCNLGLWKEDFFRVNGFDERFVGWGYEDSDLVMRLIHIGVRRKNGRFALAVFHLWHPPSHRGREPHNYHLLMMRHRHTIETRALHGIDQYGA